ncbi:HAD-IIA family hydrolase [Arthrobacter sp. AOP36-A1-22]|uniref:HAD-IIA family hydrolase n=1 Tax=Arthrobacter sp. AOP36-A1-22 TaxID=3457684 RepID=UPI00264B1255|nr:HAD-IIA family hydrolase [Micrococcaceae bacterium]
MLISCFDAVLSDLDGVVYTGPNAIEGAPEALGRLAGMGVELAYITNNASRSPEVVARHIRQLGAPAEAGTVFGSADAGADLLAERIPPQSKVLVVGSAYLRDCVVSRGMTLAESAEESPAAVIQGFDPDVNWCDLAEAAHALNAGAMWVATNTDMTIPRARGLAPGNGALVRAVSSATSAEPLIAGKPEPLLFQVAAEQLEASKPLVVGDRLDTDILGGNRAGFATAVVLTGVDDPAAVLGAPADQRPRFLLGTLAELYLDYPIVQATGKQIVCGHSRAGVENGKITVEGSREDLTSWRAACCAWWYANPHATERTTPEISFNS